MSEQPIQDTEERSSLKPLAIEGKLPLKTVGIENLREANPQHLPPHPWFARRPTPASRSAILASVLPRETNPDGLLKWMQIGPSSGITEKISEYVEKKQLKKSGMALWSNTTATPDHSLLLQMKRNFVNSTQN